MGRRIFTFWEPKSKLPGYIQLCMRTWAKYLPDYEVVVCNYSNLGDYLDRVTIPEILCEKMTLLQQADCVRAALLKTHGGIWLDADTIITSADCFKWMKESEVVMIGRTKTPSRAHVGFIHASRPNADFMNAWYSALPSRVRRFRMFYWALFPRLMFRKRWREMKQWDYCANAIIDPILESFSHDEFMLIDRDDIGALPECLSKANDGHTPLRRLYRDLYLRKGNARAEVLGKTKGIVMLHNSWMPEHYRNMTADEFLGQDILLADLLRILVADDAGPVESRRR